MNAGSLLGRHAKYRREHLAVVCGNHRLSFGEVDARVNRFANALLELGLRKGDKLAVILPNCIELLDAYRAAARLGIAAVPLSPLLRGSGLVTLLRDSETVAVLACASMVPALDEARADLLGILHDRFILTDAPGGVTPRGYRDYATLVRLASAEAPPEVEIDGSDIFNIIYSSGTTGLPKGIVLTHETRALYATLFANEFRFTPESVVLHAGSLVFNGAFITMLSAWLLGCKYILHEKFDAVEFIETVYREQVTHVMMVPSQIVAVLNAPNFNATKLASLQMLCSVGAPWLREHKERMLRVLPNSLYELYGLTEGFITVLDRSDFAANIDSVGLPIPFSDMKIIDADGNALPRGEVGEIVGRGPLMMRDYWQRPDLTSAAVIDGWLHTGDVGMEDENGFLHLVDRKKDMIISGGVNVFPKDIEEVAVMHPSIREAAVFGIAHEKWGEAPVAAVILHNEESGEDADGLKQWINARVAAKYQQLCRVVIVDDFPRSTSGKTLKRILRDQHSGA